MSDTFLHIVDSISKEASGPSYSVPRLCRALAARGATVRLVTVGDAQLSLEDVLHETYPANFANTPILDKLRFSRSLKIAIDRLAATANIIHVHGLWRMSNVYPSTAARRRQKRLIHSPRGMLGEAALKFSSVKKQMFWKLAQGAAARAACCLHATSYQEYQEIRAYGLDAPVAIIPNGIDVLPVELKQTPTDGLRTLLYLGRLHPQKGLEGLIDAWRSVSISHPGWKLDIVGPIDSDYARAMKQRLESGLASRARLVGPLYGTDKIRAYQQAELFVLPSLNESFAMTVAEALAQGTPVISTKGTPWSELVSQGCGWWVDHGVEPLAAALDEAMSMSPKQLACKGEAGRAWMSREFDWANIAASMSSVYDWLSGRGARPSCVVVD